MLTSFNADILDKPFSQIKLLKQYYPNELDAIKQNHKEVWSIFKKFIFAIYENLPNHIAKPHIENWCNGWQIRNHYFAYFKDKKFIQNAPIISILFNKKRLIIQLDWHAYKADISKSTLQDYNRWINKINFDNFYDFYIYDNQTSEYDKFIKINQFDINTLSTNHNHWYKLALVIEKEDLNNYTDAKLIMLSSQTILKLLTPYYDCQ